MAKSLSITAQQWQEINAIESNLESMLSNIEYIMQQAQHPGVTAQSMAEDLESNTVPYMKDASSMLEAMIDDVKNRPPACKQPGVHAPDCECGLISASRKTAARFRITNANPVRIVGDAAQLFYDNCKLLADGIPQIIAWSNAEVQKILANPNATAQDFLAGDFKEIDKHIQQYRHVILSIVDQIKKAPAGQPCKQPCA